MHRLLIILSIVLLAILFLLTGTLLVRDAWSEAPVGIDSVSSSSTAFTYQGSLSDDGQPAEGVYDFVFVLYDSLEEGSQVGSPVEIDDLAVSNGLFTVELDFEQGTTLYDGTAYWLEISVRPGDETGLYTKLFPRQALTSTPFAAYAARADWGGLLNMPAGFDDDLDDDTLADLGCADGLLARSNGSIWNCSVEEGDISGVSPGAGLSGGGSSGNVSLALGAGYRLPQDCENGEIVEWTGSSWRCTIDDVGAGGGGGDIYGVVAGYGLEGGGGEGTVTLDVVSGTIQTRINEPCPPGSAIQGINQDGSVLCEADNDTTYRAGSGLELEGITLTITSTYRLPQECTAGEIARWDDVFQLWICAADLDTTDDQVSFDEIAGIVGTVTGTVAAGDHDHASDYASFIHNHDDRYFTQADLISGTAEVNWANLRDIPTELSDGDDDFLASLACAENQIVKRVGGAWSCGTDEIGSGGNIGDITAVYGGLGLTGDAETGDVTLDVGAGNGIELADDAITIAGSYQLPQICSAGQIAKWNDSAGAWECAADINTDTDTTYSAGPGLNLSGTTFSITDTFQLPQTCSDGELPKWNDVAGAWDCGIDIDNDTDTTYLAGTGLIISGTTFVITNSFQLPQGCTSGQIISWDGAKWACSNAGSGGSDWSLTGNSGTTAGANFLGTTDDESLELRVNDLRVLLLEPAGASPNIIAGYSGNSVGPNSAGATIGGGGRDGVINRAGGDYSTIAGGAGNSASGYASVVGGGESNNAAGSYASAGGGSANITLGDYASISGGQSNMADAVNAAIGGGYNNIITQPFGTVSGGALNRVNASYAAVGGGQYNSVSGDYGTIAGGGPSDPGNPTISNNQVLDDYGTISGGGGNVAGSDDSDPGSAQGVTVGGGVDNIASASYATCGGGQQNSASGYGSLAAGGTNNSATASYASVAGGTGNNATANYSSVAGGSSNSAGGQYAVVGGGRTNTAGGAYSSIGGGYNNEVTATFGTIPGGAFNYVSGTYGFAAGYQARVEHQGSFVWSDSIGGSFASSGPDQFLVQATGGVGIGTNNVTPSQTLSVGGNAAILSDGQLAVRGVYTGTIPYLQKPSAIDTAGSYIYVTSSATNTLTIIDVSNPDHPSPVGVTTSGLHGPVDIEVEGGLAFIASEQNNHLVVMDISDPSQPESIGSSDRLLAKPQAVHVIGTLAYVASFGEDVTGVNDGLAIFDVSDPTEPLNRDFIDTYLDGTNDVFVAGEYAYVTSEKNDRLVVFNISDPENIVAKGYSSENLDRPSTVEVRGSYAYVLGRDSDNLVIFDIRDSENIAFTDQATTNLHTPRSLYLSGDIAYVAFAGDSGTNANSGLAVFDISDPTDIQVLSVNDMSDSDPYPEKPMAITGNGRHIYVANEAHNSVTTYDINHLTAPALLAGTVQAGNLESTGDTRVNQNLSVGNGLIIGPGGALIEGQLSVAGQSDNYILGNLSLGAAGIVYSDTEKTQITYPSQRLDVHGDARFRVNENHSLILASPPTKGAFFDFTTNNFGAYYTPTARIEFSVPDPFTGTTHTTEVKILTQSESDTQVRGRMTIGEEVVFHNVGPDLNLRTTITLTENGDVLPGEDNSYLLGNSSQRWETVYSAGGVVTTSDERLKEGVADLDYGLDEVNQLRPVSYSFREDRAREIHYGLIAQEVLEILPEMVDLGQDPGDPLGLNYAELTPVLVNAIQEQQGQIESQADQIATLEERLSALEGDGGSLLSGFNPLWGGALLAVAAVFIGRRRWSGGGS